MKNKFRNPYPIIDWLWKAAFALFMLALTSVLFLMVYQAARKSSHERYLEKVHRPSIRGMAAGLGKSGDAWTLSLAAESFNRSGDLDAAGEWYLRALDAAVSPEEAWDLRLPLKYARTLFLQEKYDRAAAAFQSALAQFDPFLLVEDRMDAFYSLGQCYAALRRWDRSRLCFLDAAAETRLGIIVGRLENSLGTISRDQTAAPHKWNNPDAAALKNSQCAGTAAILESIQEFEKTDTYSGCAAVGVSRQDRPSLPDNPQIQVLLARKYGLCEQDADFNALIDKLKQMKCSRPQYVEQALRLFRLQADEALDAYYIWKFQSDIMNHDCGNSIPAPSP